MKKKYSKRNYYKKVYWSGDKKDLRKSFPGSDNTIKEVKNLFKNASKN